MAITTIVFDMGGVLVDFDAKRSLATHFAPGYHELINEKTFASETWKLMDKGDFEVEEAIEIMCREIPAELHDEVSRMILDHEGEMPPIEEMYSIVKTLKENGYKIYLLSNCPSWFDEFKKSVPAFEFFDGFIVSARYNLIKPGKEIFNVLFKEFSLNAEECFFIDDSPANVTTANEIGMTAHCFSKHEISKLIDALRNADITF
ncbi:MAG: HAD family phosphatase [Acutalibacteraceae bacterium]|nr:HAD family phosphatase [Acutalibacteraceae bacterium]